MPSCVKGSGLSKVVIIQNQRVWTLPCMKMGLHKPCIVIWSCSWNRFFWKSIQKPICCNCHLVSQIQKTLHLHQRPFPLSIGWVQSCLKWAALRGHSARRADRRTAGIIAHRRRSGSSSCRTCSMHACTQVVVCVRGNWERCRVQRGASNANVTTIVALTSQEQVHLAAGGASQWCNGWHTRFFWKRLSTFPLCLVCCADPCSPHTDLSCLFCPCKHNTTCCCGGWYRAWWADGASRGIIPNRGRCGVGHCGDCMKGANGADAVAAGQRSYITPES